jgi:hypothetical protein
MGTVTILILTHLSVLVIGWIIGASKASCPPDREMDEYGSKEPVNGHKAILEHLEKKDEGADDETPMTLNYEAEMAHYIILRNGWELRNVGDNETKVIKDGSVITKQLTSELNKWIVDNYEPNGEPKPLQESNEN